ncbi:hypothetical protein [Gaiella sp.]|uniref:hypothetical protein n=1 Tax=Gaiella sp. TaxID=2663207 RepID=UPI003983BA89
MGADSSLGLVGVGLLEMWRARSPGFRLAALGICLGTGFVLEDEAVATLACVPLPLLVVVALGL